MYFGTLFPVPEWLSGEDQKTYNKFKRAILREIKHCGIGMDTMLATHVQNTVMAQVYVAMAERAVFSTPQTSPDTASARPTPEQLESLGRLREQLRNSMNDLRAYLDAACVATMPETLPAPATLPATPTAPPVPATLPESVDPADPATLAATPTAPPVPAALPEPVDPADPATLPATPTAPPVPAALPEPARAKPKSLREMLQEHAQSPSLPAGKIIGSA